MLSKSLGWWQENNCTHIGSIRNILTLLFWIRKLALNIVQELLHLYEQKYNNLYPLNWYSENRHPFDCRYFLPHNEEFCNKIATGSRCWNIITCALDQSYKMLRSVCNFAELTRIVVWLNFCLLVGTEFIKRLPLIW